jgi:hypothetical protein
MNLGIFLLMLFRRPGIVPKAQIFKEWNDYENSASRT